jgi:hypothetical protein
MSVLPSIYIVIYPLNPRKTKKDPQAKAISSAPVFPINKKPVAPPSEDATPKYV